MQRGCHQFFACAALADDEHRLIGRRGAADRLEHLAHRDTLTDQLRFGIVGLLGRLARLPGGLRPQRPDFKGQGALSQCASG